MDILIMAYIYLLIIIFGACIGSFINVVAYRLPKGIFTESERSYCPACEETLKWKDLIPILSYVFLRGRCRYCGEKISMRYPLAEVAGAILAVLCFTRFGFDWRTVVSFCVCAILLAVTLIDFDTMEIPNSLIVALIPFTVAAIWVFPDVTLTQRIIGFFAVSVPMFVLAFIVEGAFGGGDIKLIAVCGFLLGWQSLIPAFFISLLLGGGYAVYLLASGKSKSGAHIAFGPYLCAGIFAAMLWGPEMIKLYLNLFI